MTTSITPTTNNPKITTSFLAFFKANLVYFLALAFVIFLVYFNSLNNQFVADDVGISTNGAKMLTLPELFKYPFGLGALRLSLLGTIYSFCQSTPACYHVANILFHVGNAILVFSLVKLRGRASLAFISSLLFATHPLLTETITWISGGGYAQYTFFFLLSFLLYILSDKYPRLYVFSILASLAALYTVDRLLGFPVFFLYELLFGNIKKNWKKLVPFALIIGIWVLYSLLIIQGKIASSLAADPLGNSVNPLVQFPFSFSAYLKLFFWPNGLAFYHSVIDPSLMETAINWVITLSYFGLTAFYFKKNKQIFFWLAFFPLTLWLYLLPLRATFIYAERYVYLSSVGLFIALGLITRPLLRQKNYSYLIFGAVGVITILLGVRTFTRNQDWVDSDHAYITILRVHPEDPKARTILADKMIGLKDYQNAKLNLERVITVAPNFADAYFSFGNLYKEQGDFKNAARFYKKATELNPLSAVSFQNLALSVASLGDLKEGIIYLDKAIDLDPQNSQLYTNLGVLYLNLNKKSEAKTAFQKSLDLQPNNISAQEGLKQSQ